MRFSLPRFNGFTIVYWVIAIATAQHTAWGAATTMQGAQPSAIEMAAFWWLQGIAFAIAIDFTMVAVATKIRSRNKLDWKVDGPYIATFAMVAIASAYFQLLYAWGHATELQTMGGVAPEWQERLQGLIAARIVIAPVALPVIATLYTIAGLGKGGEVQSKGRAVQSSPAQSLQSTRNPAQSVTIEVANDRPALPENAQSKALPEPQRIAADDGKLTGWICPGCGKELSISGWSRHKKTCGEYLSLQAVTHTNGRH